MSLEKSLRQAANLRANVLLSGKHGCGKTAVITKIFNEVYGDQGKDWLYFSGSTLDPWVDFVGVPRQQEDKNGPFLELVKPRYIRDANIKAIFIDEYNRAPAKVRNAVMELLQFRSINGHKMPKLEVIWTAVNPPDPNETYNVDEIDPAQRDRFPIQINVPYEVDRNFFKAKYGEKGAAACNWWDTLSATQRDQISPRRLDYAVDLLGKGYCITDTVIPKNCDALGFCKAMSSTDPLSRLAAAIKSKNTTEISDILADPGSLILCIPVIEKNASVIIPHLNAEQKRALGDKSKIIRNEVVKVATAKMQEYEKKIPDFYLKHGAELTLTNFSDLHKKFFGFPSEFRPTGQYKGTQEEALKDLIAEYNKS